MVVVLDALWTQYALLYYHGWPLTAVTELL